MKRPLQVGVTGGIGSGKSLVCRIFHSLSVPVYDADDRAKELMQNDPVLIGQIKSEFGTQAYSSAGIIDRTYIARHVFGKSGRLEKLNQLVHPRVSYDYEHWVKKNQDNPYLIKEAALIFEAGSWKGLDKVIVVSAPEAVRMKRVLHRDAHRSETDVENIFKSQMPEDEKRRLADFIIVNDESQLVIPQVLHLHNQFIQGS